MTTQQKTIIAGSDGITVEQLNREITSILIPGRWDEAVHISVFATIIYQTIKVICLSSNEVHLFYPVTHTGLIVFEACNNRS